MIERIRPMMTVIKKEAWIVLRDDEELTFLIIYVLLLLNVFHKGHEKGYIVIKSGDW